MYTKKKNQKQPIPDYEKRARSHFIKRWRERISTEVPNYDLLKEVARKASTGQAQDFLVFDTHTPPHGSRWISRWQGKKIVIVYDHAMRCPVSCWVHADSLDKVTADV